jgi:hypothetical protein
MKPTVVALFVVACLLAGCGSGGGTSGESTVAAIPPAKAKRQKQEADAICTRMVTDAHRLGRRALSAGVGGYDSTLEFTTEGLIAPALPVVERSDRELRAVTAGGGEPRLDAYVAMFDPILSLLIERVRVGRQGDAEQAHELEEQLIELGSVQKTLATEAGLKVCTVDLVGSFTSSPPK